MQYRELQDKPVVDSPNNDAFEAIVELYYQSQGYITSAGKWFFAWEENKKQRGYQDIDVLAVGQGETVIVSVSSNLDDKIRCDMKHSLRVDMLDSLKAYFQRTEDYLKQVNQYRWLVSNSRIRRVVAYLWPIQAYDNNASKLNILLQEHNIELLSGDVMLRDLNAYIDPSNTPNVKIQNQMLRLLQVVSWVERSRTA